MLTEKLLLQISWQIYGDQRGCYRRRCLRCKRVFFVSRPDAKYCRNACRQWAYRQRRKMAPKTAKIVQIHRESGSN